MKNMIFKYLFLIFLTMFFIINPDNRGLIAKTSKSNKVSNVEKLKYGRIRIITINGKSYISKEDFDRLYKKYNLLVSKLKQGAKLKLPKLIIVTDKNGRKYIKLESDEALLAFGSLIFKAKVTEKDIKYKSVSYQKDTNDPKRKVFGILIRGGITYYLVSTNTDLDFEAGIYYSPVKDFQVELLYTPRIKFQGDNKFDHGVKLQVQFKIDLF